MFDFLRFAAIVGAFVFGLRANAMVRYRSNYGDFMAVPLRVLVGLAAWTMLIAIFISKWSTAFGAAVVTAIPLAITAWNIHQEGSNPVKPTLYLLFASMGIYSRMVMYFTIIGIGVVRRIDRGAQIGTANEIEERRKAFSGQVQKGGGSHFEYSSNKGEISSLPRTLYGAGGEVYTKGDSRGDFIYYHDSQGNEVTIRSGDDQGSYVNSDVGQLRKH